MNNSLTYEEFSEFITDMMRLQFFWAWGWAEKHPEESFREILKNRIDLCRKTDPDPLDYDIADVDFERPAWLALETELMKVRKNCSSAEEFEEKAYDCSSTVVDSFIEKTFGATAKLEEYQCGCLKYDEPADNAPTTVAFHIGNPIAPKSIFADPSYLADCLHRLMDKTESKFDADTLKTTTWLNSLPKWLEYFPQEWQDNLTKPDTNVYWHYGFWGQFISAKGTVNHKYASKLRETGEFLYYPRGSHCSFAALRKHLNANF